jgi:hypothetical protein
MTGKSEHCNDWRPPISKERGGRFLFYLDFLSYHELMSREAYIQKIISIFVVGLAVTLLSNIQISYLFIVAGTAHGFGGYYYQYLAKKMTWTWVFSYIAAFILIGYTLVVHNHFIILALITDLTFVVHFLLDEVMLMGKKHTIFTFLESSVIFLLYAGFIIDILYKTRLWSYFVIAALFVAVVYVILATVKKYEISASNIYFYLIAGMLLVLFLLRVYPPFNIVLGATVIAHYSNWYVFYYFKVRNNYEQKVLYILRMLFINSIMLVGFIFYQYLGIGTSVLVYFFSLQYFLVGTIIHNIFLVRRKDLANSLLIP